jgi:hypothetical protein
MRCPECEVRNSVAARKCVECGKALPRKRAPLPYIVGGIAVIGLAGAGLMGIGAAVTVKRDPQSELTSVAKRVAGGPKSPADAEKLKQDLDKAVKEYLKKSGGMSAAELAGAMQAALPSQTFEVHTFELPRGLKIVEIDTMLQASAYLVMKNETDIKVVNMPGMEVCDGAQVVNDPTGPVLIAVGHTAGQGPRRPIIKVYSLMPDAIRDQSDKSVAPIKGEGNVAFAKNNKDVNLEVSLYSIGVTEGSFVNTSSVAATADDELLKTTLVWDHGKFVGQLPGGRGQLAALHAVAHSLKSSTIPPESKPYLSSNAQSQIANAKTTQRLPFTLSKLKSVTKKRRGQSAPKFGLFSQNGCYIVELAQGGSKGGGNWIANSVEQTSGEQIVKLQVPGQPKLMPSAMVPSVVRQNLPAAAEVDKDEPTSKGPALIVERRGEKQIPVANDGKSEPVRIIEKTASEPKLDARTSESSRSSEPQKGAETQRASESQKAEERRAEERRAATQIAEAPKASPRSTGGTAVSRDPSIKDAPAVTPTAGFVKTSNDPEVQVRRGPSGVYRTVMRLSRGEQIQIIGRRDGWYKVRTNSGREGFIQEGLVSSSKPIGEPVQESAPPRRQEAAAPRRESASRDNSYSSRAERRREERRLEREARMAAARERKSSQPASSGRTAPHAEEPTQFVP